ncbi:hypothetical protein SEA_LITTLETOKYO_60 [Arthrobacter phage LittleTokyo]|nr:hypothetical protein SEA_LITTLETOKYO_60 [Arthrobacter phage LittleTokyo]
MWRRRESGPARCRVCQHSHAIRGASCGEVRWELVGIYWTEVGCGCEEGKA